LTTVTGAVAGADLEVKSTLNATIGGGQALSAAHHASAPPSGIYSMPFPSSRARR